MTQTVAVFRYQEGLTARFDSYDIPFTNGMTLLDVIFYIQQHLDPTLGFRYECRQGICGTCGMMLNKKPVLACSTQLTYTQKPQTIEPLANFPVERDLIVNVKPILDRYMKIKPYLDQYKEAVITKTKANESKPFRKCIECGCCIAGSGTVREYGEEVLDPMQLVKIARYVTDPRDGLNRKVMAEKGGVEKYSLKEGKVLADICPRGVPIDKAVAILKK